MGEGEVLKRLAIGRWNARGCMQRRPIELGTQSIMGVAMLGGLPEEGQAPPPISAGQVRLSWQRQLPPYAARRPQRALVGPAADTRRSHPLIAPRSHRLRGHAGSPRKRSRFPTSEMARSSRPHPARSRSVEALSARPVPPEARTCPRAPCRGPPDGFSRLGLAPAVRAHAARRQRAWSGPDRKRTPGASHPPCAPVGHPARDPKRTSAAVRRPAPPGPSP